MPIRDRVVLVAVLLASVVPVSGRTAECIDYRDFIRLIGSADTNFALGVAVAGPYAYVADGGYFQVIDVSNPSTPSIVASTTMIGHCVGVAVAGNFAYVADRAYGLRVVDVSNPATPQRVASIDTPGIPAGVAIFGNHAYVADGQSGVHVIEISEPTLPVLVGTVDTPGEARAVAADGTYVYVADGSSGFQVLDVSDPAAPTLVGGIDTPSVAALGLTVVGFHAYVADGSSGLEVIDVSDPSQPVIVGNAYTPDAAWAAAVMGSYAYVASGYRGVHVVDISDPASPVIVGRVYTPDHAVGVVVEGIHAYVADEHSGIQIFDVSTPFSSPLVSHFQIDGSASNIALQSSHAYVAAFPWGLRVVDFADPTQPKVVGSVPSPPRLRAVDVAVTGSLACVATTPSREDETGIIQVVDISNPGMPQVVGEVGTYGYAFEVETDGHFAYVADGWGLVVIDLSDADFPIVESQGIGARCVTVAGQRLYVIGPYVGHSPFFIYDISSPPSFVYLGTVDVPGLAHSVAIDGSYAYVACDNAGLAIVDVSEPSAPRVVRQIATRDRAGGVAVSGGTAYVADGWSGLQVIDVVNPSSAAVVGEYYELFGSSSVAMLEDGHVLLGGAYLSVLPTQCPVVQPVELSSFEATGIAGGILLSWRSLIENEHLGFNVLRSVEDSSYERANPRLIEPPGPYSFLDMDVSPGVTYYYRLEAMDRSGGSEFFGPVSATAIAGVATGFMLEQNYPNPFVADASSTVIGFSLGERARTTLRVYDPMGRAVRLLADEELDPGAHMVTWDGRNDSGQDTGSGVYYYRLQAGTFSEERTMVRFK